MKVGVLLAGFSLTLLAGCQTTQQALDAAQSAALDTALARSRFEMGCPEATGTVLSRTAVEPAYAGPRGGVERFEYTVGVEGCGKRETSVVICQQDGTGCFAAQSRR